MTHAEVVADIVALSPALVAVAALLLNYRWFASLDARLLALEKRVDGRMNLMQADMRDLNKSMLALEIAVDINGR